MTPGDQDRLFRDWSRVTDMAASESGTIVWDPTVSEYVVLWDDAAGEQEWERFTPAEAKEQLEELK